MWEVLLSTKIRWERDGTICLGEGENETVVIHSRRTAIILRGGARRAGKALDQKREHKERTTAVTVGKWEWLQYTNQCGTWRSSCRVAQTGGRTPNGDVPGVLLPWLKWIPLLACGLGCSKRRSDWKVRNLHGHKRGWGRPPPIVWSEQ